MQTAGQVVLLGTVQVLQKYEVLSRIFGGVTKALSTLLNLIPVLGLGDLIVQRF